MIFDAIRQHVAQDASMAKKVKAVYLWNITDGKQTVSQWSKWHISEWMNHRLAWQLWVDFQFSLDGPFWFAAVDLKNGPGEVYRGEPKQGKAGCTLTATEDIFVKMASGELNGQQVFLACLVSRQMPFILRGEPAVKTSSQCVTLTLLHRHSYKGSWSWKETSCWRRSWESCLRERRNCSAALGCATLRLKLNRRESLFNLIFCFNQVRLICSNNIAIFVLCCSLIFTITCGSKRNIIPHHTCSRIWSERSVKLFEYNREENSDTHLLCFV